MMQMTAAEAWAYLAANLEALDRQPVLIEWVGMDGTPNADFTRALGSAVSSDTSLLLLCRSGVRSLAAGNVALEAGYQTVINISDGFEGDLDAGPFKWLAQCWPCLAAKLNPPKTLRQIIKA